MGFWSKHPGKHQDDQEKGNLTKYKTILLAAGLILFIGIAVSATLAVTDNPLFCQSCHEMKPEYSTWKATAHHNIKCVSCHREQGFINMLNYKTSTAKEVVKHFTGFKRPIVLSKPIEDEVCIGYHSNNRLYTPSGDIIIPHQRHKAQKVPCVTCHEGVTHGKISDREVTKDGNLAAWTLARGRNEAPFNYTKPAMSTCMDCHYKKQITVDCLACHKTIDLPKNHKASKWTKAGLHGVVARQNLAYCHRCHSYSIELMKYSIKDKTVENYARINTYCATCHMVEPPSHAKQWLLNHKTGVYLKGESNCLVCHNENISNKPEKVSSVYCNKCHGEEVHPSDWRRKHPKIVKDEGITNRRCFSCHDNSQCSNCHTNPAIKPY